MSITFYCECGQALSAADACAGLEINCPVCGHSRSVPHASTERPDAKLWKSSEQPIPVEARDPNDPFAFGVNAGQVARERSRQIEIREYPSPDPPPEQNGESGGLNGTVVGGAALMLIAVIWFGVGLLVGEVFYIPLVLLFIGFTAVEKGLAGDSQ